MKALVTGNRGFIGRSFEAALRKAYGFDVTGFDLQTGIDARDYFRRHGPQTQFDLVIHAAAIVGGRMTIELDPMAIAADLAIDAEMFNWAIRTEQKRVVYFSSSAAYPAELQGPGADPLSEDLINLEALMNPDAIYGWVKLTGEMLAKHAQAEGLKVTVVRPFSGYGAFQSRDYPFPALIDRAKKREDPFEVWGDGGRQVRDFIHIRDIIQATMAIVEDGYELPVNLCTGRGISFAELAKMICEKVGYSPEFDYREDRPTGVMHRVGDPTLMRRFFEPKISLEEGIDRMLRKKVSRA